MSELISVTILIKSQIYYG